MELPKISCFDLKGKTVILRVDINSPIKNGRIIDNDRIHQAINTIKTLKKLKSKVLVLAHQGRRGGNDFISLKQHASIINKQTKIIFSEDDKVISKKTLDLIKNVGFGDAVLLDNVRFINDEFSKSKNNAFVKVLSSLADFYVNDAFSVSHRFQSSVTGFPQVLPSAAGPNLEREINFLNKLKNKKTLYILAGSKFDENILLLKPNNKIIVCGLFGQLCMRAKGFNFGKQNKYFSNKDVSKVRKRLVDVGVINPEDFAVNISNQRKELFFNEFPSDNEIYDIGSFSIKRFTKEISMLTKQECIFMKGPAGYVEDKKFSLGTESLLKAIAKSPAFSLLGGGHLSTMIKHSRINKKSFGHLSLSGGALVDYISGIELPGLICIMNSKINKKLGLV